MGGTIFFWLGGIRNNLPNMRFYHLGNFMGFGWGGVPKPKPPHLPLAYWEAFP